MGTPSVSGDALRRSASDTASLGAARQIAPRSNAEGRQLGQAFLAQLEASANSMSNDLQSDPSGGGDDDQSAALPDMSAYSMLPAVTALQQGKQGTDRNMSALLSMISGATQATGGADALNADATGLPADPLPADTTTSSVGGGASTSTVRENATIVADVARRQGADPRTAIAMMLVESGGNERSVGDQGSSFGLFQLHQGGMLTAAGLTPEQALDPRTNAGVALQSLASYAKSRPNASPGEIAAASQRPADPTGYASRVNAMLARADALLAQL